VPDLPKDNFGVVWTGDIDAPVAGDYHFDVFAQGTGRLFIEQKLIAEDRIPHPTGKSLPAVPLRAGQRVPVRLEYAAGNGVATAKLLWRGPEIAMSVIPKDRLHPRSTLTNRTATLAAKAQGLLGTYYANADFTGPSWTRFDPGIEFEWSSVDPLPGFSRTNFSVRWTGQLLADHSESYTFFVLADEPARLWLDGKLVLATGAENFLFERRETIQLTGGERHDIRFETHSTSGNAIAKLAWNSPSTPKAPVPATHLFPSKPTRTRDTFIDLTDKTPPGVLLQNNTFLAGTVERATESSLRLKGRDATFSMVNVARIIVQPLAKRFEERIAAGRPGALLAKGDFVDVEFKGIEDGKLRVSSILFGPRSYEAAKEVIAVVLRNSAPSAAAWEIRLLDHSVIHAASLNVEGDSLIVRDTMAGTLKLAFAEVAQIKKMR